MNLNRPRSAVIVAHPDDETLWSGGVLLGLPHRSWFVAGLCRAGDADRAPRFRRALAEYRADGALGDLDDGPDQRPLADAEVDAAVLALVPPGPYDVIYTHSPGGEYTRHRRHEEVGASVLRLWRSGALDCAEVFTFAYEDGGGAFLPRAKAGATLEIPLSDGLWRRKADLIHRIYGFPADSWEFRTTPRQEAFQRAERFPEVPHESSGAV